MGLPRSLISSRRTKGTVEGHRPCRAFNPFGSQFTNGSHDTSNLAGGVGEPLSGCVGVEDVGVEDVGVDVGVASDDHYHRSVNGRSS